MVHNLIIFKKTIYILMLIIIIINNYAFGLGNNKEKAASIKSLSRKNLISNLIGREVKIYFSKFKSTKGKLIDISDSEIIIEKKSKRITIEIRKVKKIKPVKKGPFWIVQAVPVFLYMGIILFAKHAIIEGLSST